MSQDTNKTAKIAALNDAFRASVPMYATTITEGVRGLSKQDFATLMTKIQNPRHCWTEDNDPYGEHDFGVVIVQGTKYFFKIDYYDTSMICHSLDPADAAVTKRIMTIGRLDEY